MHDFYPKYQDLLLIAALRCSISSALGLCRRGVSGGVHMEREARPPL